MHWPEPDLSSMKQVPGSGGEAGEAEVRRHGKSPVRIAAHSKITTLHGAAISLSWGSVLSSLKCKG